MELLPNILISDELNAKVEAGTLTISDHLILALANFTAALLPNATTYTEMQQQSVDVPAVFVDYYDMKNSKRLSDTSEYTFGIEITYVPKKQTNTYELQSAIFTILQSLETLNSDIGTFSCYDKDSDITDGLAHVTGTVSVGEITLPTDPIIKTAKELII